MLKKLISQFEKEQSIEKLIVFPEERRCIIPFEDNVEVEALELDKSYLLKGNIGSAPQQNTDPFLLRIMEANLFGIGTRGAVIGLNGDGNVLTLSLELEYNCPFKEFEEKLEDFVSVIDFWRNEAINHE